MQFLLPQGLLKNPTIEHLIFFFKKNKKNEHFLEKSCFWNIRLTYVTYSAEYKHAVATHMPTVFFLKNKISEIYQIS